VRNGILAFARVHKTANILNKVALSVQADMKKDLCEVYSAQLSSQKT
jgi:hypothetical protein